MVSRVWLFAFAAVSVATSVGRVKAEPKAAPPVDTAWRDRYFVVDPRLRPPPAEADLLRLQIHGDYQFRYTALGDPRLMTYGYDDYRASLGQSYRVEHTMRLSPQLQYGRAFTVVTEFDVPTGFMLGETTDHVNPDYFSHHERQPMRLVPRYGYVDIALPYGHLSIGQQGARWGSSMVLSDGNDRPFLGDSGPGTLVERVAYQGRPLGADSSVELLVAGDLLYANRHTRLRHGDISTRGTVGVSWVSDPNQRLGLMILGEQLRPQQPDRLAPFRASEQTLTFDLAGRTHFPVPGRSGQVFAEGEFAFVTGRTDLAAEQRLSFDDGARVERWGAMLRVGAAQIVGKGPRSWGKWALAVEWGLASGDDDPTDGVDRRFAMSSERPVGLLLYGEVLRWKTARAAMALRDSRNADPTRWDAGWALATGGGVSASTYLGPMVMLRPLPNLDVRGLVVLAQSTTDLVDPAAALRDGVYANYDGGDPTARDLGCEVDGAVEYRYPLAHGIGTSLGLEAGVFFPGKGFDTDGGLSLGTLGMTRVRFGFYY